MFSKQDVVKPRTAEDLERKYNFAETNRLIAENVKVIADTNKAIASISRRVSDNGADIVSLTSWKDGTDESIARITQTATNQGASIESLVSWKDETTESVASIEQRVTDNEAAIELLSQWDGEGAESLAQLVQTVNANSASIESLTEWKDETTESVASISQTASAAKSEVEALATWQGGVESDVSSIASIKATAEANAASIESVVGWQDETTNSIASITQTVTDQGALIELKASKEEVEEQFGDYYTKEETNAELTVRDEEIATSVSLTYATIDALTGVEERVSSAETSITQNADAIDLRATKTEVTEAKDAAIASANASTDGKLASYSTTAEMNAAIEISAENITSSVESTYATKDDLSGEVVALTESISTIEQTANKNGAGIGLLVEYSADGTPTAKGEVLIEAINGESSAKISADRVDIEGKTLNIKVDHTNIVGEITAEQIDVDDLSALNATIGQWNIRENGLYADNNTVGLNGSAESPIRMYAGLEKRSVGAVQLSSSDFRKTQLSDGWYAYNGTILDSDGEVVGAAAYTLLFPNGVPGNIIATNFGGMFEGYPGRAGSATPVSVRNVSATYYADTNQVEIDYFESETSAIYEHFFSFDLVCAVSEKDANFRVHGDGTVDAAMLNAEEARCQSVTIDGVKLSRKTAAVTGVTTTKHLHFAVTIEGKKIKVYEILGESTGVSHGFWINYTLNGGTSHESNLQCDVVVPRGQSFGTFQVPCKVYDTISNALFAGGTASLTITETISEEYAPEYIDVENAVKVERLKIGNSELTEEKLAALLSLL